MLDPGHEGSQADGRGRGGEIGESRVGLQHRIPGPPHLGDLAEVVHHPQAGEAGRLGSLGDCGEVLGLGCVGLPVETGDLEPELER